MKKNHYTEWRALMDEDPFIACAGDWIRWPYGSIDLLFSILDCKFFYDDPKLYKLKKQAWRLLVLFIVSSGAFILIAAILYS